VPDDLTSLSIIILELRAKLASEQQYAGEYSAIFKHWDHYERNMAFNRLIEAINIHMVENSLSSGEIGNERPPPIIGRLMSPYGIPQEHSARIIGIGKLNGPHKDTQFPLVYGKNNEAAPLANPGLHHTIKADSNDDGEEDDPFRA
jgi:hypothetical protein